MAMDPGEKRKKLYTEGVVRLGSRRGTYDMKLYPLVSHSVCIRRHVDSFCEKKSSLLIKLPACPGGPDIFKTVEDFCYGLMKDNAISIANVVDLIVTSNFLELDGLACRTLKFLEDNVFVSWESCLNFMARFDCKDRFKLVQDANENSVFHKCKNAFLRYVKVPLTYSKSTMCPGTMCCNLKCLLRVAEQLSPRVAEHIYKSCRSEQVGLCFNNGRHDHSDHVRSRFQIPLCIHIRRGPMFRDEMFTVKFYSLAADKNHGVKWIEDLFNLLPNWSRRATLVLHLGKSMLLGDDFKVPTGTICFSRFRWSFLCALLVETTRLRIHADKRAIAHDLDEVIGGLQRMVSRGLRHVVFWNPKTDCNLGDSNTYWSASLNSDFIIQCVIPFSFDTLRLVLRHFRSLSFDQLTISSLVEILDKLLGIWIKIKAFTVRQALLIYQEFPNKDRLSHAGIYQAFQYSLRIRALSAHEVRDLTQLLDYEKLSDHIVKELFEEFQIDCNARLLQRYLAIQENRIREEKSHNKVTQMQDHKLRIARFIKVQNEMRARSVDLIKIVEDKLLAERHVAEVVRDLEAEKEKSTLAECKLEEVTACLKAQKKKTRNGKRKLEQTLLAGSEMMEVASNLEEAEKKKTLAEHKLGEVASHLEVEKMKTTCQICFTRPRDVLSLPCMHFMYCSDCLQSAHQIRKICPTCRSCTSGVLKCNLSP